MAVEWGSDVWVDWCPGCGDFGILTALKYALSESHIDRRSLVIVSGIGCSGKMPHFVRATGVHALHGRAIPFATGIKASNPGLKVIVHGGDGDLLGIGMGHFIALGRRNAGVLVIIHNNWVYGLTKGQASPTLKRGVKTKALALPNVNDPVNPILLGMSAGYTFLARSYAYNLDHLKSVMKEGLAHKGAGVIEVLQPCVTWNNIMDMDWMNRNSYVLEDWDPVVKDGGDFVRKAQEITQIEAGDKVALGTFLVNDKKETFEERLATINELYASKPPAIQEVSQNGRSLPVSVERTFGRFLV